MRNALDILRLNFAAPENTTKSTDIEPVISKDHTNRLALSIKALQEALGIAYMQPMAKGTVIKRYKLTGDMGAEQATEGDVIPLTEFTQSKLDDIVLKLHKRARLTTWDAIASGGRATAINAMDARLVVLMAQAVLARFYSNAITKAATDAGSGTDFQNAFFKIWAAVTKAGEKYGDTRPVVFANPDDAGTYLGNATIITQAETGLTYLENFGGMGKLVLNSAITPGTLFGTFRANINGAYIGGASELAESAGLTYDASGMVGMKHSDDDEHGGIRTTVVEGVEFYLEDPTLMFKSKIAPNG